MHVHTTVIAQRTQERIYLVQKRKRRLKWLWARIWRMTADLETNGRLLIEFDDLINLKTGKKIFGFPGIFAQEG